MHRFVYRNHDYNFGQMMQTIRSNLGLTQTSLADVLGVSRRAVSEWESGGSYPKADHLKNLIVLALKHQAFPVGQEADEIRSLWKASHQKILLDESWLKSVLSLASNEIKDPDTATNFIDSIPAEFTVPRKIDREVHDLLPFQPTSFVGRYAELAEIDALIRDKGCRLLTLLGPGGVGKTRLAMEAATRLSKMFRDGIVYVDLAPLGSSNQIVSAISDALDLPPVEAPIPKVNLLNYLTERQMMVILDNFEHLLDGVDFVLDILREAPHITLLVTSRERLNLRAEWLFDVKGLSYPTNADNQRSSLSQEDLMAFSAIELFVQRASQVQQGFSLSQQSLQVVHICQQVAGMPLAIELAASSLRQLSIFEIEQDLQMNLDMLATTVRDISPRHRSIQAVFDHSWNLLTEPEQSAFCRLAVFRGGYTQDAAQQIAGASHAMLLTLMDKSLIQQTNSTISKLTHTDDSLTSLLPRFMLLEPIREYARRKLTERGEEETVLHSHAAYYLKLTQSAIAQWDSPTARVAAGQLDQEHDNIYVVLQWSLGGGDLKVGLQLAAQLRKYWQSRGKISEGRKWLADLLALANNNPKDELTSARQSALTAAAWLASNYYDFVQANRLFEENNEQGDLLAEADLLINKAREARSNGHYQQATLFLENSLSIHRRLGNRGSISSAGLGLVLWELGMVLREQGNFRRATEVFEDALQLHYELGDREGVAQLLMGLGDIARDHGNAAEIRKYCEESLATFRELGVQWAIGFSLNNLAVAAYIEGDFSDALAFSNESVSVFRRLQLDSGLAEILTTLGHIFRGQGNLSLAQETLVEALRKALIAGPRLIVAQALEGFASVIALFGQIRQAVQIIAVSSTMRVQMGTPLRPIDRLVLDRILADAQSRLGTDLFTEIWLESEKISVEEITTALLNSKWDDPDGGLD